MRLVLFQQSHSDSADHVLPEHDMVVDPRPISHEDLEVHYYGKFRAMVNGLTLTVQKTDGKGWKEDIYFRVYKRNERRFSFTETKYIFHGVKNETAPKQTTEVFFKDDFEFEEIPQDAFLNCAQLRKITLPSTILRIGFRAFAYCTSLRSIQLPPNLKEIGVSAFNSCTKMESVYLPPELESVGDEAFRDCGSLRICNFPDTSMGDVANCIVECCPQLMHIDGSFSDRYNDLHNICWCPTVTAERIRECIKESEGTDIQRARTTDVAQFTPLHLLAANESATGDMIRTYLNMAPDVAIIKDCNGQTPLHMLCSRTYFSQRSGCAISAYIIECREGKTAAFMKDNKNFSPLNCLCSSTTFPDMDFLKNKNFGSLIKWWFDCIFGSSPDKEKNCFTTRNKKRKLSHSQHYVPGEFSRKAGQVFMRDDNEWVNMEVQDYITADERTRDRQRECNGNACSSAKVTRGMYQYTVTHEGREKVTDYFSDYDDSVRINGKEREELWGGGGEPVLAGMGKDTIARE